MAMTSEKDADETDRDAESGSGEPREAPTSILGRAAEEAPAARDSDDASVDDVGLGDDMAAMSGMLGPERWVQFGFIALGFAIFFFVDKIAHMIWSRFAQPNPFGTALIGFVVGLVGAFYGYRHPKARKVADEVVEELSQVTWPSRQETYTSTIVVVVTSVVAALYTGAFDALWSALTDLVYHI